MARPLKAQARSPGDGRAQARVLYRLPEPRRSGPDGRRLAVLAGAAALLFVGGVVVGRASTVPLVGTPAAPASPPTTEVLPPGQGSPAASQAPAPAAPVPGSVANAGVGPARTVTRAGVRIGVGYARSPAGAVAAATNYSMLLSDELVLDPVKRRAVIDTIAAPEARAALRRDYDENIPRIASYLRVSDSNPAVLRLSPVGYHVDRYDGRTAQVSIWATGIVGGTAGVEPRQGWGVTTVKLRWAENDWKETGATSGPGPVPLQDDTTPTAASKLVPEARKFKEYNYAPGP